MPAESYSGISQVNIYFSVLLYQASSLSTISFSLFVSGYLNTDGDINL